MKKSLIILMLLCVNGKNTLAEVAKYNDTTELEQLRKHAKTTATLCLTYKDEMYKRIAHEAARRYFTALQQNHVIQAGNHFHSSPLPILPKPVVVHYHHR